MPLKRPCWRARSLPSWVEAAHLVNSMFHSCVFTWLGVYFHQRYGVSSDGIGLAILG